MAIQFRIARITGFAALSLVGISVAHAQGGFDFGGLNIPLENLGTRTQNSTPTAPLAAPPAVAGPVQTPLARDNQIGGIGSVTRDIQMPSTVQVQTQQSGTKIQVQFPVPMNPNANVVDVRIAAGSEKRSWFEAAATQCNIQSVDVNGRQLPVRYIIDGVGSIEAGRRIRAGNKRSDGSTEYQVWAPATSGFRALVEDGFSGGAFDRVDSVARSPMVFLTFKPVQDSIDQRIQKTMSFDALTEIFNLERTGQRIGSTDNRSQDFNFAISDPSRSNGGAAALITMAYEYFVEKNNRTRFKIRSQDLQDPRFQAYIGFLKAFMDWRSDGSGRLIEKIVNGGYGGQEWASIYTYENLAVKAAFVLNQRQASADHRPLIRYPKYQVIADHPFMILKHGNTQAQVDASRQFLDCLMGPAMQKYALQREGFRPVSGGITNEELSSVLGQFVQPNGLVPDLRNASQYIVPAQDGDVLDALIRMFAQLPEPTNL